MGVLQDLKHIAFIMDGNGRWALERGMPRLKGHEQGAKTLTNIIHTLVHLKIPMATFFVFSSENWSRPKAEVAGLLALLKHGLKTELSEAKKNNVKVHFYGDRSPTSKLDAPLRHLMTKVEEETAHHTGLVVNLCINYGGHDDILRAAQALAHKVAENELTPQNITADVFAQHLDAGQMPPPDMCIRTGGKSVCQTLCYGN